eukprot:sb/3461574/
MGCTVAEIKEAPFNHTCNITVEKLTKNSGSYKCQAVYTGDVTKTLQSDESVSVEIIKITAQKDDVYYIADQKRTMEATVVTSYSPDEEYFAIQDKSGTALDPLNTTVLYGDDSNIILKLTHTFVAGDAEKTGYFVVRVGDVLLTSDKITFKNMESAQIELVEMLMLLFMKIITSCSVVLYPITALSQTTPPEESAVAAGNEAVLTCVVTSPTTLEDEEKPVVGWTKDGAGVGANGKIENSTASGKAVALQVPGIVSFPSILWYVPEKVAVMKFQCIAVTSDTHAELKGLGAVSGEPIKTRLLGHVTGYPPIRDQYFLIRSVPRSHHGNAFEDSDLAKALDSESYSGAITESGKTKTASMTVTDVDDSIDTKVITCNLQAKDGDASGTMAISWASAEFRTISKGFGLRATTIIPLVVYPPVTFVRSKMNPLSPSGTIETLIGDTITFTASVIGPAPTYFSWTSKAGDDGEKVTIKASEFIAMGTVSYWTTTIASESLAVDCSAVYDYSSNGARNTLTGTASISSEANRATVTASGGKITAQKDDVYYIADQKRTMEATVVTSYSPDEEYFAIQDKSGTALDPLNTTVLYGDDSNIILKLTHTFVAVDADKTGYFVVRVGDVLLTSDKITFKNMESKVSSEAVALQVPGIVSFPSILWYVPEKVAVMKFQCIAVTSDTHAELKGLGAVSGEPIKTRLLGHVTGYPPIRDQYFLIRSVPRSHHGNAFEDSDLAKALDSESYSGAITESGKTKTASMTVTDVDDSIDTKVITCNLQAKDGDASGTMAISWASAEFRTISKGFGLRATTIIPLVVYPPVTFVRSKMNPLSPSGTIETLIGDTITFTASVIGPAPTYFSWTSKAGDDGEKVTIKASEFIAMGTVSYWTTTIASESLAVDCSAVYDYSSNGARNTLTGTASISSEANRATVTASGGSAPIISIKDSAGIEFTDTKLYEGMTGITIRCNQTLNKYETFMLYKDGVDTGIEWQELKDAKDVKVGTYLQVRALNQLTPQPPRKQ